MKNLILLASTLIFCGCAMDNAKLNINNSLDASQALSVEKIAMREHQTMSQSTYITPHRIHP